MSNIISLEGSVRTTLFLLMVVGTSTSCYQYFPVDEWTPLPEEGAEVRIQLESPQSLDLGTMTINDVSQVEGHVYQSNTDTLGLFSNTLRTFYGFRQRTNGAVFYFDRSKVRTLEQRRMVKWKTAVALGTAAVGLGALWYFAVGLGDGGETGGELPPPPDFGLGTPIPVGIVVPLPIP